MARGLAELAKELVAWGLYQPERLARPLASAFCPTGKYEIGHVVVEEVVDADAAQRRPDEPVQESLGPLVEPRGGVG